MTNLPGSQKSLREKLSYLLWEQNPAEISRFQSIILRQIQTVALVFRDFNSNQCLLRASALTYYTMLSLVPLLALTFALLKAFGVQNLLEPLIIEKLNVGDGQIAGAILGYINNTQVARLGTFGLVFLCVAVISLLTNVEKAFNHVWGVKEIRPPMRRFADYLSVILVGPVLIISAISMTSTLTSHNLVQKLMGMQLVGSLILLLFKIAPFIFMWLAFTGLYIFMSNTRVEWRAAFVGGVVGWHFVAACPGRICPLSGRCRSLQCHLWNHGGIADFHGLALSVLGDCSVWSRGLLCASKFTHQWS